MAHVRLLLIGDSGTGKSTLISSFISHHFPEDVPSVLTDSIIPQDKTSDNVTLTIMDSSARPGDREILKQKIRAADTIFAVFDTTRPETLDSIMREWLPLIRSLMQHPEGGGSGSGTRSSPRSNNPRPHSPHSESAAAVFIVGTKKELLSDAESDQREREEVAKVRGILKEFGFVQGFQRCSAKTLENVDEIFYLAETAVTFPLGPLFDSDAGTFTPACKRALHRIFRAADEDRDNLLSDQELTKLQERAFGDPLERDQVVNIKKQITLLCKKGTRDNKITPEGFLAFMELYVQKFQPQVPWIVLKRFGYDDALRLCVPDELMRPPPGLKSHGGQHVTELSSGALQFLRDTARCAAQSCRLVSSSSSASAQLLLQQQHDEKKEVFLTHETLAAILSVLQEGSGHPWRTPPLFLPSEAENLLVLGGVSHSSGDRHASCMTLNTWLAHWQLLAMHSPVTVQTLLYRLGFVERGDDRGIRLTTAARGQARSALKVGILGPRGAGKVSLVCALAGVDPDVDTYYHDLGSVSSSSDHQLLGLGRGNEKDDSPIMTPDRTSLTSTAEPLFSMEDLGMLEEQEPRGGLGRARGVEQPAGGGILSVPSVNSIASSSSSLSHSKEGLVTSSSGMCLWKRRSSQTCVTGGRLVSEGVKTMDAVSHPASIVFTAVPEPYTIAWMARHGPSCDAVVLVFEAGSLDSFQAAVQCEMAVPDGVARFYVATKSDLAQPRDYVTRVAQEYLALHGLLPLLVVSSVSGRGLPELCDTLLALSVRPEGGIPLGVRRKREAEAYRGTLVKVGLLISAVIGVAAIVIVRSRAK